MGDADAPDMARPRMRPDGTALTPNVRSGPRKFGHGPESSDMTPKVRTGPRTFGRGGGRLEGLRGDAVPPRPAVPDALDAGPGGEELPQPVLGGALGDAETVLEVTGGEPPGDFLTASRTASEERGRAGWLAGARGRHILTEGEGGGWISASSGSEPKEADHVSQISWTPLPARSHAPMKLNRRMSVGLRVSDVPPAIATSLSTSSVPELVTSRRSGRRTTVTVEAPP